MQTRLQTFDLDIYNVRSARLSDVAWVLVDWYAASPRLANGPIRFGVSKGMKKFSALL